MKNFKLLSALILLLSFVLSCAAPANINKYPKRQIDRPYTLPDNINTWEILYSFENIIGNKETINKDGDFERVTSLNPFIWTHSLSDNLNLVWSPLPLNLKYQFMKTDKSVYGGSVGISGLGYSSVDQFTVFPDISLYQKYKFNNSLAIENNILLSYAFETGGAKRKGWRINATTGPLFQLSENFSISPRIHFLFENDSYTYIKDRYTNYNYLPEDIETAKIPFGLWAGWIFHDQWEINSEYTYSTIGYASGQQRHNVFVRIIHYW